MTTVMSAALRLRHAGMMGRGRVICVGRSRRRRRFRRLAAEPRAGRLRGSPASRLTGCESAGYRLRRRSKCGAAGAVGSRRDRNRRVDADAARCPGPARGGTAAPRARGHGRVAGPRSLGRPDRRARHLEPRALRRGVPAGNCRSRARRGARRGAVRVYVFAAHAAGRCGARRGRDVRVHAVFRSSRRSSSPAINCWTNSSPRGSS